MIMCWGAALIRPRLNLKSIFKLKWRLITGNNVDFQFLLLVVRILNACHAKDGMQSVLIRTNAFLQESERLMDLDAATAIAFWRTTLIGILYMYASRDKDAVIMRTFQSMMT